MYRGPSARTGRNWPSLTPNLGLSSALVLLVLVRDAQALRVLVPTKQVAIVGEGPAPGQSAPGDNGYLSAADWNVFNNKQELPPNIFAYQRMAGKSCFC